ncbi:glucosamine-fructose-6-phosphate aminotransferase [Lasallia pustulata]|uniref:Glucosamine-fructose-6-phosphate aminotransferase n=1 Tax=Lasallia pustulata TaxID=136370 RepID=A0A1W5CXK7_9LECA|nr:glucosamine-fructose-6-phosphate aminotransferase [Lasallia pustulata]
MLLNTANPSRRHALNQRIILPAPRSHPFRRAQTRRRRPCQRRNAHLHDPNPRRRFRQIDERLEQVIARGGRPIILCNRGAFEPSGRCEDVEILRTVDGSQDLLNVTPLSLWRIVSRSQRAWMWHGQEFWRRRLRSSEVGSLPAVMLSAR